VAFFAATVVVAAMVCAEVEELEVATDDFGGGLGKCFGGKSFFGESFGESLGESFGESLGDRDLGDA
jgi:hypothetical protein